MKLDKSTCSIAELRDMLGRKDMVAGCDKTNDLKQAMMQKLLTGRTRLI